MFVLLLVPCVVVQKPMAALSFGQSAPRSSTVQTTPLSGHAAPPAPPTGHHKDRNGSKCSVNGVIFSLWIMKYSQKTE